LFFQDDPLRFKLMRVLVTGASGFIGSAVVRALLGAGREVLGLVRSRQRGRALESWGASLALGDMLRPDSYQPLAADVDAVIHAAQQRFSGRWTRKKIRAMHGSDALMTRTLAEACLRRDIPFVYTSGALTHRGNGPQWIDETTPLRPCLLAQGHAEMVQELQEQHRERRLRAMFVSPGYVYGPGGFLAETVDLMGTNQYRVIAAGDNYWGLIHVDDLADLYVRVLDSGRPGENYFACDDHPLTWRNVIDRLAEALGVPRVGSAPGWIAGLWLGFPLVDAITSSIRIRNQHARQTLAWTPQHRSFSEALPEVLQELRNPADDPGRNDA
jgi:nucleoside-diphosphate-sugar epimerase